MAEQSVSSTYDNMLNTNCTNSTVTNRDVTIGSTNITAQPGSVINIESKGSLIRTKNSNVNITATEIQRTLKIRYRDLALPKVSWMKGKPLPLENYFIPLQLRSSRWSRGVMDRNCNLENIFDCDDSDQVSRVLIESQAGYGKTTLVHKIMHDWVREKNYIRPFECAVMIILKHLKGRTTKDAILDEINLKIDNERVWEMINNDKTLLLLDGLDEVSEVDRQNVLKTLYDRIGCKMTIIVTCRVGLFKLEDDEMSHLFRGVAKSERFWDKVIAILGLNGKNRERFLQKFVEVENRDEILKKIADFINRADELFESPLMLILLVYITLENPRYNIKTETDLFKNLIDCIVKRSVNDKDVGDKLEQNFTLFDTKTNDNCQYHELLCTFGITSMDHILNDKLQFECDEFTDSIYRIGLLRKHEKDNNLEILTHYECFHLAILEFVAAFALWNEFKNNGNQFSIQTVNKINGLQSKKGGTSMVIPFLCGLMETNDFFNCVNIVVKSGEMAEQTASSNFNNILNPSSSTGNVNVRDVAIGSTTTITAQSGAVFHLNSNSLSSEVKSSVTVSTADIRDKLRRWYRNRALPVVSWMNSADFPVNSYFVPLQLSSSRGSREKTDENYNLENIFDCDDDDQVSRILIESQAGYGKTALIHKIMDDWVRKKNYTRPFEYAVMINLNDLKGHTIKEAVLNEINTKIDNDQVWELINGDNTLLLLDGLDEVSENDRKNVLDTLYDFVGHKMTIVITCRVGLFKLTEEERNSLCRGAAKSARFWDNSVMILGFNGDNRQIFLEKFVEEENRDEILKIIKDFINQMKELFESPLMLVLIVYMTRESPKYKIKTKTDLLKNLVDYVIKKSINDKDVVNKLEQNFTLFGTIANGDYHDFFRKYGEVSIDHVLSGNLQFKRDKFTDLIYRIGFLTNHELKRNLETLSHCSTIVEFAAAFALWNEFKQNGNQFSIQTVNKINGLRSKKGEILMVIPFLCGLMETDVVKFFIQFADYSALYSTDQELMELILSECSLSEELYGPVSKFIPPVYFCFTLQKIILKSPALYRNIVSLTVSVRQLWVLARERNINVKSLTVSFTDDSNIRDTDEYLKYNVKCDELCLAATGKVETYENVATQFKLVLNCVSAKNKYVYIKRDIHIDFLGKCVDSGIFNNHTLEYLYIELPTNYNVDATARETVGKVIENFTIKHLAVQSDITLESQCLDNIVTCADSSNITSLYIQSNSSINQKVDLSTIVKKEEMCWDYVGLWGFEMTCTVPVVKNNCIKSLIILWNVSSSCLDILFLLKLTELSCSIGLFGSILRKPNWCSWVGFESIVTLILNTGGQFVPREISTCWDKFRYLELVTLNFSNTVIEEVQPEILRNLNMLKTTLLRLRWQYLYSSDQLRVLCNVVNGIQNMVEKSKLKLVKTIDFEIVESPHQNPTASQFDTVIESIISAVKCDSKITATFFFSNNDESVSKSRQLLNAIDLSNMNVQQIVGDMSFRRCIQRLLYEYSFPNYRILKLQRKEVV